MLGKTGPRVASIVVAAVGLVFIGLPSRGHAETLPALTSRVVAVGIPGAGAVSAVGAFHPGGPIHDKPEFSAFTQPGRILDPVRVLVTSSSNFGAPLARLTDPQGSVLSIDPASLESGPLILPAGFAEAGTQARTLDGRVQLLTAQSAAFLNGVNTPGAVTADLPPVSNPLGISINNGFGRLWFANAPGGAGQPGTLSIVDPGGQPLASAPSRLSGGVFAGDRTARQPEKLVPGGLGAGAVATALLGMSPDGSKRAVFAVLTADGALAQAHTEQSVDGLAPPGTIAGLPGIAGEGGTAEQPMALRAGMAFNWVPDRILYVTDPARDQIVTLKLTDDGKVFRLAETRILKIPGLDMPVDLAPAVPETANPTLASNSTMAGGSDLYVVSRGSGTIMRVRQDGTVLARRQIMAEGRLLGAGQLNGIAVSPDAQRLWITVSGPLPDHGDVPGGALLEVAAFGPDRAASLGTLDGLMPGRTLVERGAALFQASFSAAEGLGPLFNGRSCVECHARPMAGGVAPEGTGFVLRVGRLQNGVFDALSGQGGPVARAHSGAEGSTVCNAVPGIPAAANVTSVRSASALFGLGLIEAVPDEVILELASRPGQHGRVNSVRGPDGRERPGRFGWKADTASLEQFVADAFRNEMGITSPLASVDLVPTGPECPLGNVLKDDGGAIQAVTAYLSALRPLSPPRAPPAMVAGRATFGAVGCDGCHRPTLQTWAGEAVPLYSDLLLHDMGPGLNDGVVQGTASGAEWRTTPLWGLNARSRLLHDGRATSVAVAILAHDGEGAAAAENFRALRPSERQDLLAFLDAI